MIWNDAESTPHKATVRIVIADDHPVVRDALKTLLQLEDDFAVVGEAGDGREVLDKVRRTRTRRVALGPAHAESGRPAYAAGAPAEQPEDARRRADGLRRPERA